MDINIKNMYYFLVATKEASSEAMTYIIPSYGSPPRCDLAQRLTPRAKVLLSIVILHGLLLFLNIYVFAKLAEEVDISLYGRRRKY